MKTFKELREFNFNKAVKSGYLEKSDKATIDKIQKTHKIVSFLLTSSGYELQLQDKKTKKFSTYMGKNPQDALKQATKGG